MNKQSEVQEKENKYFTPEIPELKQYMEEKKDKDKGITFTQKYFVLIFLLSKMNLYNKNDVKREKLIQEDNRGPFRRDFACLIHSASFS